MNGFARFFPALVAAVAVAVIAYAATPQGDPADGMHLHDFGTIPVLADGRIKPIDTVARNDLVLISGHQTFRDNWVPVWVEVPKDADPKEHLPIKWASDPDAEEQPAIKWLLDSITDRKPTKNRDPHILSVTADGPDVTALPEGVVLGSYEVYSALGSREHPVFRIENDQVLNLLGLEARPGSYRYSLNEIGLHWKKLAEEVDRAKNAPNARPLRRQAHRTGRTLAGLHRTVRQSNATRRTAGREASAGRRAGYGVDDAGKRQPEQRQRRGTQ